ncbi:molybdopterin molybdotransferase MoeA [Isoptericola sp. b441]|uniref:Molybdopterin molybdenumtransferase n=1 Tax=Actinotalea lenta TaxID=3064654 RepID=A0ABT9D7E9_9CELL|nr:MULTISPECIES: gephyrin-like molybdotransferase Glp [unclassified Isoptericola]MDO8106772.1 molybdopterin molybdotransferase MoeA [Isoptericola sp. b441]MDO8121516.1 molybdopterin molybdotransferase MoeA [Isoptericola sp. b490]
MRTVADHLAAVLDAARPVPALDVVLADAAGCVLAEDVVAGRDVPVLAVAGCDGYAVRTTDVGVPGPGPTAEVTLPVVEDVPVTTPEPLRLIPGASALVAAGAPVPAGADAVVPLERTDRGRARVAIRGGAEPGENLRAAGSDVPVGARVLAAGTRLAARHLAVAATVGRSRLRVHPRPRVVVLTVGDELVEPGRPVPRGRRHDADGHALAAAARDAGAMPVRVGPVPDERGALREVIADQLVRADLMLITGGLSAGPWDTVTDVLAPLGTVRFDHVAMTPGDRQGFGTVRVTEDSTDLVHPGGLGSGGTGVPLFAVPGHPVAAMISYEVFVRPALRAMGGHADVYRSSLRAAVARPLQSPAGMRHFVPARLSGSPTEGYVVDPVGDPSEPSIVGLASANALMVVGEDTTRVRAGDSLPCLVLEG